MHIVRPNYTTGTNVVSLDDAKEFLRVDHDDEDTTITALLDAAVAWVEDYTSRSFSSSSLAIFSLGFWRKASLAFGPVSSIVSVTYKDTSGASQTLSTDKYYYETLGNNNSVMIYFHDVPNLEEYNAHPITVNAVVGASASSRVKHAVKMLVAHWYENRRAVVTGTITAEVPIAVEALLSSERIIDLRQ